MPTNQRPAGSLVRPLEPCRRQCLKCGKPFRSRDRTTNRLCRRCAEANQSVYQPRVLAADPHHYTDPD